MKMTLSERIRDILNTSERTKNYPELTKQNVQQIFAADLLYCLTEPYLLGMDIDRLKVLYFVWEDIALKHKNDANARAVEVMERLMVVLMPPMDSEIGQAIRKATKDIKETIAPANVVSIFNKTVH